MAWKLKRYNIDVAALCETDLTYSGSLVGGVYTFFWGGKGGGEK